MSLDPIVEHAVAVRMTCSQSDLSGSADQAPVIVTFDGSAPGQRAEGMALRFPAGATPMALHEGIVASAHKAGATPTVVAIENEGLFRVQRKAEPGTGRLCGKIVVITGAAQGFGRGIAEELLAEGACVVVADLNAALGATVAKELNARSGDGSALFCRTDVTDSASLDACVAQTVKAFGGVDIFISNAGVLKAGAIDEMDASTFDLVTNVNYRGYFLGVKAVAPVMKLQHQFNPRHFMDIVQINSKSGLEGSNRNFAYAGSKFGGIGLTQSFALELIGHNIKVNAICPGNYFDGPLWSDPQTGLFVQYLRAGKVPGAKTIEDVKNAYVSKVPARRGCFPRDVAKAILYLHEQEYETGQALPVTGGQVMLN